LEEEGREGKRKRDLKKRNARKKSGGTESSCSAWREKKVEDRSRGWGRVISFLSRRDKSEDQREESHRIGSFLKKGARNPAREEGTFPAIKGGAGKR